MAIFSNQATLTYNGNTTNSNVAYGEILDVLTATKTSIEKSYTPGETITYVVALRNTGNTALTGLTITDNLGGYNFNGSTIYPLTYVDNSATVFINGAPQATPPVVAGPPLVISDITIPGNADAVIIYQAQVNEFANPGTDGTIVNIVTITGDGISTSVTATQTVTANSNAMLNITKSITPSQVVDNDRVTYTFIIQNTGNEAVVATDDTAITDTFDPILSNLAVTFEGTPWTQGVQYNYTEATGLFTTVPGQIVIPPATYVQDPVTGAYTATPGTATLVVVGTI